MNCNGNVMKFTSDCSKFNLIPFSIVKVVSLLLKYSVKKLNIVNLFFILRIIKPKKNINNQHCYIIISYIVILFIFVRSNQSGIDLN